MTIEKGRGQIILQMYPIQYHGESQLPEWEFTSDNESQSIEADDDAIGSPQFGVRQNTSTTKAGVYQYRGPGEYLLYQEDATNSDHAIAEWMNNFAVNRVSTLEPNLVGSHMSDNIRYSNQEKIIKSEVVEDPVCQSINLGTNEMPQLIKIYVSIIGTKLDAWKQFFVRHKSTFAWSYADLKGIPAKVCEH